jgi:tetratricopeptide (TPR) repeat protein
MSVARKLLFCALLSFASQAPAQQGGDVQAQILYAYQTEDANALANLIQDLSTQVNADAADPALRYHLAHALYRRGLLAAGGNAHEADVAFAGCVDQLKPVLSQDAKSVESLLLQSACYAGLADLRKIESVLLRSRSQERLRAALELAPRNPRALFISSTQGLSRSKPGSPDRAQAFAQLQLAAKLFEAASATGIDSPGWGHAEAYLALGRELQSRGDRLGARNWVEKSLIAAPDDKAAQRQLALLTRP